MTNDKFLNFNISRTVIVDKVVCMLILKNIFFLLFKVMFADALYHIKETTFSYQFAKKSFLSKTFSSPVKYDHMFHPLFS